MNKIIHIDINIPFYTFACHERYILTELIFQHYLNIKEKFKDKARFTFTLIGSENDLSKELALKYFKDSEDIYIEFDQEAYNINIGYNDKFLSMLTDKFKFSYKSSFNKNPNISLLCGSNDLIDFDFFNQIIDSYDGEKKQLFGIDNYSNGNNIVLFLNNYYCSNLNETNHFIWDGQYKNKKRSLYKYSGGTIGFNDTLYKKEYNNLLDKIICFDEGEIEYETLKLNDVHKFNSKNTFYFNIKTNSNKEITSFNNLREYINGNILNYNILSDEIKLKITDTIKYLNLLFTEKNLITDDIISKIILFKYDKLLFSNENSLNRKQLDADTIHNKLLNFPKNNTNFSHNLYLNSLNGKEKLLNTQIKTLHKQIDNLKINKENVIQKITKEYYSTLQQPQPKPKPQPQPQPQQQQQQSKSKVIKNILLFKK